MGFPRSEFRFSMVFRGRCCSLFFSVFACETGPPDSEFQTDTHFPFFVLLGGFGGPLWAFHHGVPHGKLEIRKARILNLRPRHAGTGRTSGVEHLESWAFEICHLAWVASADVLSCCRRSRRGHRRVAQILLISNRDCLGATCIPWFCENCASRLHFESWDFFREN